MEQDKIEMAESEKRNYRLDPEYISSSLDELKVSIKELTISVGARQEDVESRLRSVENWRAGVDATSVLDARRSSNEDANIDISLLLKVILGLLAVAAAGLGISGTGIFN